MTYKEMVLQPSYTENRYTPNIGIEFTKQITKTNNKAYTLKDGVDGPETLVIFSTHFIDVFRDADSNECMARMSKKEKELYWDYIHYQNIINELILANPTWTDEQIDLEAEIEYDIATTYETPELVVRKLSEWAVAEVMDLDVGTCYNSLHEWED